MSQVGRRIWIAHFLLPPAGPTPRRGSNHQSPAVTLISQRASASLAARGSGAGSRAEGDDTTQAIYGLFNCQSVSTKRTCALHDHSLRRVRHAIHPATAEPAVLLWEVSRRGGSLTAGRSTSRSPRGTRPWRRRRSSRSASYSGQRPNGKSRRCFREVTVLVEIEARIVILRNFRGIRVSCRTCGSGGHYQ